MAQYYSMFVLLGILILMIVEFWYDRKEHLALYNHRDTRNNILVGLISFAVTLLTKLIFFAALSGIYHFRLCNPVNGIWSWILCILGADFSYYWYHRCCHEVNWFWVTHSVHHSSKHLNISTAFRQSLMTHLTGHFIFWLWMPLLGFSPDTVLLCHLVVYAYQGYLHTEIIGKMPGIIEFIFNTPSHHRVHHGSNPEYLDKNHGGMLIIWDRLFGTFCPETTEVHYGLTHHQPLKTPRAILFGAWVLLYRQCRRIPTAGARLRFLFGRPTV